MIRNPILELADRRQIGNMKGILEEKFNADPAVVFLSGAEMDFKTAPIIRKRLAEVAENGLYGFTCEEPEYLDAVCSWMKKTRKLNLCREDVIPTHGTVFSLGTAIRAFTEEEDGVIIQAPSYYRFDRIIVQNQRKIIRNPLRETEQGYVIDFQDLEEKMADPKNKLMVLCHPHNPSGKVFDKTDLKKIADLSANYDVVIFADEIFGELTFDNAEFVSYLQITDKNAIVSTSLGKAFNFTGVNHANLLIRDENIKKKYLAGRNREHFGSIDPFFYNAVLAGYTEEGYQWINQVKEVVWNNYSYIRAFVEKELPLLKVFPLQGGFILWLDCRGLRLSADELQDFMEKKAHLIGDPGNEYGVMGEGFYRFQLAAPETKIRQMMKQLSEAIKGETFE